MAKKKLPPATEEQRRAWAFYGTPRAPQIEGRKQSTTGGDSKQVGEVRYIVGWMADQMTRMGWRLRINGSEAWKIELADGTAVISDPKRAVDIATDARHPANASHAVLKAIDWGQRTVREVTTNLFVAGELHYTNDNGVWRVVSVVRPDREDILSRGTLSVRGIWPHPGDPEAPDSPLFGVLGVLDDMLWLNRLSRSQSANRVGMRGIIGVADSWRVAGGKGDADNFWNEFEASLSRPMDSPEDVSPVGLVGAAELVEPKDGGMKGLSWVIPDFPYDDKIDERMQALVQRLAYGLPVPPEVLLGLQAQSKATAFQVEGSTYRAHIEPVAELVAEIARAALSALLPSVGEIEVVPDPTTILARRHSVQDVLEAHDRGAASDKYLREVLGIPESAAPSDEELARREKASGAAAPEDPANGAADEPISAAATLPAEVKEQAPTAELFDTPEGEQLSNALHTIDSTLFYELVGASHAAVSVARGRLGARVRASAKLKSAFPEGLTNEELGELHGPAIMEALGVDGEKIVQAALAPTLKWWAGRLQAAMDQAQSLISPGGVPIEWGANAVFNSANTLMRVLSQAVVGEEVTGGDAVTAAARGRGLNESDLRAAMNVSSTPGRPGVAMGEAARLALKAAGVTVVGHRWQWNPGRKGGTFDPHLERDHVAVFNIEGFTGDNAGEWGALPGEGVNAKYCMCTTRWLLRGADGRFMKERNHS